MKKPSDQAMQAAIQFMMTHSIPRMSEETKQLILTERADQLEKLKQIKSNQHVG